MSPLQSFSKREKRRGPACGSGKIVFILHDGGMGWQVEPYSFLRFENKGKKLCVTTESVMCVKLCARCV